MKIAVFHEVDYGGARRTVNELAKRLNRILDLDLYYIDNEKEHGLEKYCSKVFYYPFHPKFWEGKNWKARLYKDTLELLKLFNLHKKIAHDIKLRGYDYIFVHPSKFTQAPFLLRFLKGKCIYYCQEPLRIVYDPFISDISRIKFPKNVYEFLNRKIRKWIDKENFRCAGPILTNSNFTKKLIENSYAKLANVCYLGVDSNFFRPQRLDRTIDVLFMGNKSSGYNLLEKFSKNGNKLRIRTIFRDGGKLNITDKELAEIYNKSKLLVALNYNEPFGLIPLEAMACGVPVIAISEGGYNESVVDNKTGFLISRDLKQLCEKTNLIINNERIRQRMGRNARKNVLRYWTWDKSVERFLKIIKYENK